MERIQEIFLDEQCQYAELAVSEQHAARNVVFHNTNTATPNDVVYAFIDHTLSENLGSKKKISKASSKQSVRSHVSRH